MTQAYPLQWPIGRERTKVRLPSRFKVSLSAAVQNVMDELRRFGNDTGRAVKSIIISSNVTLVDNKPADAGVAAYFVWDGVDCCIAVDQYYSPTENLQAIAKVLEAERAKMRHGGLNIVRSSFRGYASLPPPRHATGNLAKPWWLVLGVPEAATIDDARAAYYARVKTAHPDHGGDAAAFNLIVEAWKQAQQARAE